MDEAKPEHEPRRRRAMEALRRFAASAGPVARSWARLAAGLGPPLALLVLMLVFHPFRSVFEFDPDEGNNLMKARLVADGHRLHAEIWSDQPPGFTFMLAGWLGLTGWTVEHGRLLVLLCSALLLWALGDAARLTGGNAAAVGACALLAGSFGYLRLSASVMLAVPSLMFGMLSVSMALRYRRRRRMAWLAASAVCMALALFVKLWTVLLVPVALLALLTAPDDHGARGATVARWAGLFGASALALFLATVPPMDAWQLLLPHFGARQAGDFHEYTARFWRHLADDKGIALLAVAGAGLAAMRRQWTGLVPAAWAALAIAVLAFHRPLWYHHYLLVSIPLCWSGGIAFGAITSRAWLKSAAQALRVPPRRWIASWVATLAAWGPALPALAGAALFMARIPEVHRRDFVSWREADQRRDWHVLEVMKGMAPGTGYVFTDRQIVPLRAGLRVPPTLAVTSLKRAWSGNLDDALLVGALESYRPEQVLLSGRRILLSRALLKHLDSHYTVLYHDHTGATLLVRSDLAARGLDVLVRAAAGLPGIWEVQLSLANRLHEAGRTAEAMVAYRRALQALPPGEDYQPLRQDLIRVTSAGP